MLNVLNVGRGSYPVNKTKYDKYVLPLRNMSKRHEMEIDRMFDTWVRTNMPVEDRKKQFWAVMDYQTLEWRQALANMEKEVRNGR